MNFHLFDAALVLNVAVQSPIDIMPDDARKKQAPDTQHDGKDEHNNSQYPPEVPFPLAQRC